MERPFRISVVSFVCFAIIFVFGPLMVEAEELTSTEILSIHREETGKSIGNLRLVDADPLSLPKTGFTGWRYEILDLETDQTTVIGISDTGRWYDFEHLQKRQTPLPIFVGSLTSNDDIPSAASEYERSASTSMILPESDVAREMERKVLVQLELAAIDKDWQLVRTLLNELPLRTYGEVIERFHDLLPTERATPEKRAPISLEEERRQSLDDNEYQKTIVAQMEESRLMQEVSREDGAGDQSIVSPDQFYPAENRSKAIRGVGPGCTYTTLQAAVNAAISGDDIYIAGGTHNQVVNIYNKSLNIYGGANSTCSALGFGISTINGTGFSDSVFEIYGDATLDTVRLHNLDIIGGESDADYGGGIEIDNRTTVILNNTWVYGNSSAFGAGVHLSSTSVLDLEGNARIYNNSASSDGGGIYCLDCTVYIRDSANYVGISGGGNTADADSDNVGNGGGIYLDGGIVNVLGSSSIGRVAYNQAENGGGIFATNNGIIYVEGANALVGNNNADVNGGGIYLTAGADVYVTNASVNNNSAGAYGGGVFVTGTGSIADFDTIAACAGDRCTSLSYNTSGSRGAGAYVIAGAELDLESTWMSNNTGGGLGSGIYATGSGTVIEMDSVMLTDNTTSSSYLVRLLNSGGGPYVRIRNSTIAGNTHSASVFAIDDRCRLEVFGSIIRDNSGSLITGEGDVTIDKSILQEAYPGSNNLVADPLFLDPASGNYRISKNSPAVDFCDGIFHVDVDYESKPYDVYGVGAKGLLLDSEILYAKVDAAAGSSHIVSIERDECPIDALDTILDVITRMVDYDSFVWLELNDTEYAKLKESGLVYHDVNDSGLIGFGNYRFDPLRDGEPVSLIGDRKGSPRNDEGRGLQLIQLFNPPTVSEFRLISDAVIPINYYPTNAYLVWADDEGIARMKAGGILRWHGDFHPAYRIAMAIEQDVNHYLDEQSVRLYVTLLDDGRLQKIEQFIESWAGTILHKAPRYVMGDGMPMQVWQVLVPGWQIEQLTAFPTVVHIRISYDSFIDDESSDQIVADNAPGGTPVVGYNTWLNTTAYDGRGVKVAIVDSGVDWDHVDLGVVSGTEYGGWLEAGEPGGDGGGSGSGHGTHVAGIVNADGTSGLVDANGFLYGLGVAPGTTLHAQDALGDGPDVALYTRSYDSITNGADLSNNSWYLDCPLGGCGYSGNCADLDDYVHDAIAGSPRNPFMMVFSAGNAGNDCGGPYPCMTSITDPKEAKNIIVVGGSDSNRSASGDIDDISDFSSRGWTIDGRIKPDVVAPGDSIISTENRDENVDENCFISPAGTTTHAFCNGTSMSSPHVTGFAALFTEFWRIHNHTTTNPLPATIIAAIISTTDDLGGADDGWGHVITSRPNQHQGWGRINMDRLLNPTVPIQFYENPYLLNTSGDYYEFQIQVYDIAEPLRITLAWTDAPGAAGANPALVNNLNLRVYDPYAAYWRGNYFGTDGWSQSAGVYDTKNNTENVWIENPVSGVYTVRVTGSTIAGDGYYYAGDATDQHFSLVCYNCQEVKSGQYDAGADEVYALVGINGAVCEYGSIVDAVAAAGSGSTVYIPAGTYIERIGTINKNLTFVAATDDCTAEHPTAVSSTVVVDNNYTFSTHGGIVDITQPVQVTFRHMTLREGSATYGGIIWAASGSTLTLDDADIIAGMASSDGGGIRSLGTVELMNGSEVILNEATGSGMGGGISMYYGTLILRNDSRIGDYLQGNSSALEAGGVFLEGGRLEMYDTSRIRSNEANRYGGGVYALAGADIVLNNSAAIGYATATGSNTSIDGGGVYIIGSGCSLTMNDNSIIMKNIASNYGGGVLAANGAAVTMTGNSVIGSYTADYGNGGGMGGGLVLISTDTTLTMSVDSRVSYNVATSHGGGIFAVHEPIILIDSALIDHNSSGGNGGGVYLDGLAPNLPPSLTLQNSSVISNNNAAAGGGLYLQGAGLPLLLDNSLIDNNTANYGGGICLNGISTLTMQNGMTITNNDAVAYEGGGISLLGGGTLNCTDTTLQYNTAETEGGAISSQYHSSNQIIMTDCDIRWNSAGTNGGGIYNSSGTVSLNSVNDNFLLGVNQAVNGGGIYNSSGGSVQMYATSLFDFAFNTNFASNNGGGAYITNGTYLDVYGRMTMVSNIASGSGGAIYMNDAEAWFDDYVQEGPEILVNEATNGNGGGIYATGLSNIQLDGVLIGGDGMGNSAPHANGRGGGIYLDASTADLDTVTIQYNSCGDRGAGIYADNGSTISMYPSHSPATKSEESRHNRAERATSCNPASLATDRYCSEVRYNSASVGGGVYLNGGSELNVFSTAFIGNAGIGSAIYSYAATDSVEIRNSRFSDNTGTNVARFWLTESILFENNTLAGNPTTGVYINSTTATSTFNNNIIWNSGVSTINGTIIGGCNNTQDNSLPGISQNPLFVATARGGFHLGAGSPSIDTCSSGYHTDLDNVGRPKDGDGSASASEYDMGAFEHEYVPLAPPPPTPDGHAVPGTQVTGTKMMSDGSQIRVAWDNTTCPADQYLLIHGNLSTVSGYSNSCIDDIDPDVNGSFDWTSVPTVTNVWFLIVSSTDLDVEGSWGTTSGLIERDTSPAAPSTCSSTKDITGTCP